MSFGLPSVKPIPSGPQTLSFGHEGEYGLRDPLVVGQQCHKSKLGASHPLELSERDWHKNQQAMTTAMLRNTQGLHAPLRLAMERHCVSRVGHLPCLPSHQHRVHLDVLEGRDTEISFEDILNMKEYCERGGQAHAMIEKSLGIL